jgi:hypothetical protein
MEGGKRNQLKPTRTTNVNKLVASEPRLLNKVNHKGTASVSLMNRNKSKNESN